MMLQTEGRPHSEAQISLIGPCMHAVRTCATLLRSVHVARIREPISDLFLNEGTLQSVMSMHLGLLRLPTMEFLNMLLFY